jgi:hypothetical protein
MMNPRRIVALAIALAIAAGLAVACSSNSPSSSSGASAAVGGATAPDAQHGLALSVSVPGVGEKIVKTATISLNVPPGSFADRIQKVMSLAKDNGGFVAGTRTTEGDLHSGTLVVRVPASAFEATLGQLAALGTVKTEQVSGQNVTSEFVDLQARLRNWQAQETVLLRLMNQSTSIKDSLSVQGQLQNVQLQIEEIGGQLRVLGDQTAMSTITLNLAEATGSTSTATFATAWRWAVRALHASVTGLVVALGFALPFAAVAFVGLMLWLGVRRLRARPAPTT